MSYSLDMRERAIAYVRSGGSQVEASRIFGVTTRTVYNWLHGKTNPSGSKRKPYRSKLCKRVLEAHVRDYPDQLLRERAAHFGVTPQTIWHALRQLNIRKKNDDLFGSEPQ